MTQDPRHVPHTLHSALEAATATLDLPLDHRQLETLALELTGPVRALITEALETATAHTTTPPSIGRPLLGDVAEEAEVETSEYAGCTATVGLDVDLDSPAAQLAHRLHSSQHDVIATEVTEPTTLGLTVRPQSLACWRWWLGRLGIDLSTLTTTGSSVSGTGRYKDVTVHLRGDGVGELLTDRQAARLMGVLAPTTP
ncbi:hypothetical protein [Streptomyces sp. NPDC048242]|uniref:hypothetical protein n=1 Tax=Streptomyces sp. NPDC048242 TaxID=3155026 RepID=UPI00343D28F0